jgi:hypothetical protein
MSGGFSDNAFAAASTFTLLFVYFAGFISIYHIVRRECIKEPLGLHRIKLLFTPEYIFRTPIGFLLMTLGLTIRNALSIPSRVFLENGKITEFLHYNETVMPWVLTSTEMMIYIGAVIVFWPTIMILMHHFFGPHRDADFYLRSGVAFAVGFKFFLTIVGIILFYCLLGMIG